jgi:hypothetical protein
MAGAAENERSTPRAAQSCGEGAPIMSTITARYRLVIFQEIAEPQEVRDLFCRVTGMHPTDAMHGIARAPGTWPKPLEEAEVRQLLDGLYDLGIAAEAWRSDLFPELNPARTLHRAACLAEGFRAEGLRGEPIHWAPWDRIELICAGRIAAEDEYRNVSAPRWPSAVVAGFRALAFMKPQSSSRRARATRIPHDPVGEVIIVRRDPRIAFRVIENRMNYAYLGRRLSQSAAENFPIFVADLCARADEAYLTPSTRALLAGREPGEYEFDSSQALLEYATHRLLWSWYRRDRAAQAGEVPPEAADTNDHTAADDNRQPDDDDRQPDDPAAS